MSREWRLYLRDAIVFCDRIVAYTSGLSRDQFEADQLTYDAVARNIELLGEAAKHIPVDVRLRHPAVPWAKIVGTRNIVAHAYFGVDADIAWDIVANKVEGLRDQFRPLNKWRAKSRKGRYPM